MRAFIHSSDTNKKIHLKKFAYLLFFISPCIPFVSWWLSFDFLTINQAPYFALLFFFVLIPIADWLIGKDPHNVPESLCKEISQQGFYKVLTLMTVPLMMFVLAFGLWQFTNEHLHWSGKLGWILNIGIIGGILSINVAHELIHKNSNLEKNCGGVLLSFVCYGGFKIEHVRGHHVNVSTPRDPSSAGYNQSLYDFLPKAYYHNISNAWKLEAIRLKRKGSKVWSLSNELVLWYSISLVIAIICIIVAGYQGLLFFLGQSLIAFTLLEMINYIEHYGLRRKKDSKGKYQRVSHHHSWNSNYLLTNLLLIQLQRHSDHHAFPKRRYQVLRHYDDSPQLPAGYATMILLALIPPLWKKVINPIVNNYYKKIE